MFSAIPGNTGMVALRECVTSVVKSTKVTMSNFAMASRYTSGTICSAKAGFLLRPNRTICERQLKTSHMLGRERRKNQRNLGRRTTDIY